MTRLSIHIRLTTDKCNSLLAVLYSSGDPDASFLIPLFYPPKSDYLISQEHYDSIMTILHNASRNPIAVELAKDLYMQVESSPSDEPLFPDHTFKKAH